MIGTKIKINHLEGEDTSYDNKEGYVTHIDDLGQLHGTWGGLAIIPEKDDYEILYTPPYTNKVQVEVSNPIFVSSRNPVEVEEKKFNAHTEAYDETTITFSSGEF